LEADFATHLNFGVPYVGEERCRDVMAVDVALKLGYSATREV
jgi:hypothetical protein